MQEYFDYHYEGPGFELFGTGHILALSVITAVLAFLLWGWRAPSEAAKRRARLAIVGAFLLIEVAWHGWNITHSAWNIQQHLPLHLCSISVWGSVYVLLTRSYRAFEIIFFIGVAGAGQAVLTPDTGIYGLPHFRAIQTLAAHGMIVIAMVYMTAIEGFRPSLSSVWKTMLAANVYLVFVTMVNFQLGSNYMFTIRKPDSASILDLMGPWPWYILAAEFVALFLFLALYAPFAWSDRRIRQEITAL